MHPHRSQHHHITITFLNLYHQNNAFSFLFPGKSPQFCQIRNASQKLYFTFSASLATKTQLQFGPYSNYIIPARRKFPIFSCLQVTVGRELPKLGHIIHWGKKRAYTMTRNIMFRQSFISPTDAQLNCFINNFKIDINTLRRGDAELRF